MVKAPAVVHVLTDWPIVDAAVNRIRVKGQSQSSHALDGGANCTLHVVGIVEQSAKAKSSSCFYRPVTEVSCYQDLLSMLIANPSKGSILTD